MMVSTLESIEPEQVIKNSEKLTTYPTYMRKKFS